MSARTHLEVRMDGWALTPDQTSATFAALLHLEETRPAAFPQATYGTEFEVTENRRLFRRPVFREEVVGVRIIGHPEDGHQPYLRLSVEELTIGARRMPEYLDRRLRDTGTVWPSEARR